MLWEVKGERRRGVFLRGRRVSSRLIIVCQQKRKIVGRGRTVTSRGKVFRCCFGEEEGQQEEEVNLPVCRIKNKCPRSVVLSDYLSG